MSKTVITCHSNIDNQSHYIEVAQEGMFMEQNMRFWLMFGRLAILKKIIWAVKYATFGGDVFLLFHAQKNNI